jgi:hypothetical protein
MPFAWNGGVEGVTLTVEAGLSAATGSYALFDVSLFDVGTFGPDRIWSDVSQYLRAITSTRKFGREVAAWDVATASFVLDNTRRYFSPSNLSASSPYVTGGISQIRPLRPMRWSATYQGVTYYGYTGYSTAWEETFLPGMVDAYVTVPCEDEMAMVNNFDGLEQSPVGAGELSGARVHRILDNARNTAPRSIEAGRVTMQATTLAQNAATEIKLVADSEGGALFVDGDGTLVYEGQYALLENARSNTIQGVFSDGGDGNLPCWDISLAYNGDLVRNVASFARVGGTAQVVDDPSSRSLYMDRRETRTDLVCETDAQALNLATFYVERFKQPEQRVTQIVVKPRTDPKRLFPQVLGRRVRDLIRVVVHPLGGGAITQDCHIAGISHDITKDDWTTTFDLWSATVYTGYSTSRFDVGLYDQARFFF